MQDILSVLGLVTQAVGITAFFLSIGAAIALIYINRQKRIDLSLPGGNSLPYLLVVVGAGFLTLGVAGIEGLATMIAAGIFVPFAEAKLSGFLKQET